jgi:hypothetical protein
VDVNVESLTDKDLLWADMAFIGGMTVQRFLSIFRSAFRLGVLGKERFHYWRLVLWTLIRKPRLISLAITISIYGYHYRKICEQYIL